MKGERRKPSLVEVRLLIDAFPNRNRLKVVAVLLVSL